MVKDQNLFDYTFEVTTPLYELNDSLHGIKHRNATIRRGLQFARESDDEFISSREGRRSVFAGCGCSKWALHSHPEKYAEVGAQMFVDDKGFRKFFSNNGIYQIEALWLRMKQNRANPIKSAKLL